MSIVVYVKINFNVIKKYFLAVFNLVPVFKIDTLPIAIETYR